MKPARAMILATLFALLFPVVASASPATVNVAVEGAVHKPGVYALPAGGRFADAALVAVPSRQAYTLGAAVFRREALADQIRLRAALLHDLEQVAISPDTPAPVAARARVLHAWIERLPATGRIPLDGNLRRLEVGKGDSNRLLAEGDRLFYPVRPSKVSVVGAVNAPCSLPHVPGRDAADYLAACPLDTGAAERNVINVVQPDGQVQVLGTASWNRSPPQALAPGAIIHVPLNIRATRKSAPELDATMTTFLATQALPHDALVGP